MSNCAVCAKTVLDNAARYPSGGTVCASCLSKYSLATERFLQSDFSRCNHCRFIYLHGWAEFVTSGQNVCPVCSQVMEKPHPHMDTVKPFRPSTETDSRSAKTGGKGVSNAQASETRSDSAQHLYRQASDLFNKGRPQDALNFIERLLQTHPHEKQLLMARAMCLAALSRKDEAVELCDRLVQEHGYLRAAELKATLEARAGNAAAPPTGPSEAARLAGHGNEFADARHMLTCEEHTGAVYCVSISRDERWALSGGEDKTMRLWELSTGRCRRVFEGHTDRVNSVSISPDGQWGLSASRDKTLRLWDLATGRCVRSFADENTGNYCSTIGSDGCLALSGGASWQRGSAGATVLWELSTGRCQKTIEGHTGCVNSVSLGVSGRWALSGAADSTLRLWALSWNCNPRP